MTAAAKLPRPALIDERVLPFVHRYWSTAAEIYSRFGEEGPHATRHALARLAGSEKIERRYDPHRSGTIARYRKLQTQRSDQCQSKS
jgi:hypothetical protein